MKIHFEKYSLAVRTIIQTVANRDPSLPELSKTIENVFNSAKDFLLEWGNLPEEVRNPEYCRLFLKEIERLYSYEHSVKVRSGSVLGRTDHEPWVQKALDCGDLVFENYDSYRERRLVASGFNKESLKAVDDTTTKVLDYMGNPKTPHGYKTYGLLMGDVQAGKTATYTGICHKAVDAGYKIIIVLTGTKSSLRSQTQSRLDADLVGTATDFEGRKHQTLPAIVYWNRLTTVDNDFRKERIGSVIRPDNKNEVSLIVTQKNSRILSNIQEWIDSNRKVGIGNLPLLLIDDEADAASINVNKEEEDPTAINGKIRNILESFDRAAYLAVTATPFANVFIDPQMDPKTGEMRQDLLPDLFPRDYIYAMPTPLGYLGVDRLFGELGDVGENLPKYQSLIPMYAEDSDEQDEAFVIQGKLKSTDRLEKLPDALRRAVLYFLCVCVFREVTEMCADNSSMLVHIARYRKVQNQLTRLIRETVDRLVLFAECESKRDTPETRSNPFYRELESLWNDGCREELWYEDPTMGKAPKTLGELSGLTWEEIWKKQFAKVIKGVRVVEVNMDSKIKSLAKYYEPKNAKLIVVGGDALSRGLTLEGLCVSFFSRRSYAYDTLLQMGRWFGYRNRMLPYMKIWISDCLVEAFGYVSEALREFRETVNVMLRQKQTPSDFGLRIRRAPTTVKLMVTAANKRRNSKRVRALLNITGTAHQASTMPLSADDELENLRMVARFISKLGPVRRGGEVFPELDGAAGSQDLVWCDVTGEKVGNLLMDFRVPSWSKDIEIAPVAKKIIERNDKWTVRVISLLEEKNETEDVFKLGSEYAVACPRRTLIRKAHWIQQNKRGIISRDHFVRHMSLANRAELRKRRGVDALDANVVLTEPGEKPQLLIYPLRPLLDSNVKLQGELIREDAPFVTLAFGIPEEGSWAKEKVYVEYDVNRVYQMQVDDGYYDGDDE